MLFVMFHVGADRFVIEARAIKEVLPLVEWRQVTEVTSDEDHHAPPGVVGMLNYHREALPVVDLSLLIMGRHTPKFMNTRILLIEMSEFKKIALIAERVTGTIHLEEADFIPPDDIVDVAAYLGPVYSDEHGIIQMIEINRVLSEQVYDQMYIHSEGAA